MLCSSLQFFFIYGDECMEEEYWERISNMNILGDFLINWIPAINISKWFRTALAYIVEYNKTVMSVNDTNSDFTSV